MRQPHASQYKVIDGKQYWGGNPNWWPRGVYRGYHHRIKYFLIASPGEVVIALDHGWRQTFYSTVGYSYERLEPPLYRVCEGVAGRDL